MQLTETGLPSEVESEKTQDSLATITSGEPEIKDETAFLEEPETSFQTAIPLERIVPKQEKKKLKALPEKKNLKNKLKEKKSSTKVLAGAFPMVALIDEQVRTSIPEELVARVKAAKSKKHIISSNYPYTKADEGVGRIWKRSNCCKLNWSRCRLGSRKLASASC